MPINGLVVMTPTSVAKTGASSTATINSDGSVTFGSCETLSLNGVFTSSYDNYMIVCRHSVTANDGLRFRLRASGTDNSTASSYVFQYISAASTSVTGARETNNYAQISVRGNTQRAGFTAYFFGPNLSQPTAYRSVVVEDLSSAAISDFAGTHNQSSSYDGLTIYGSVYAFSGAITVYGFNQ